MFTGDDRRQRVEVAAVQRLERIARSAGRQHTGEFVDAEVGEQRKRGVDRPNATQRLERCQRAQQLRLGVRVGQDTAGEPIDRLIGVGMGLQR